MGFSVVQPPDDDTKLAEVGKELIAAGGRLGMTLETEGFLFAWLSGCRVFVERQGTEIVSMALVSVGQKWTDGNHTASVLEIRGNREGLLDFIKPVVTAIGVKELFVQDELSTPTTDHNVYTVRGYRLN